MAARACQKHPPIALLHRPACTAFLYCLQVFLEDAGFDWKILGPDVHDFDYVAWQCDQDAYACSGQKCSAQSILFMHDAWAEAGACVGAAGAVGAAGMAGRSLLWACVKKEDSCWLGKGWLLAALSYQIAPALCPTCPSPPGCRHSLQAWRRRWRGGLPRASWRT